MRYLFPAVVLMAAFLVVSTPTQAKPEFTKKEKKSCTHCHTTAKGPDLSDVGKFYKEKKTLEGAPAPKK